MARPGINQRGNTFYGGMEIDRALKERIEAQPLAEFLKFEALENGNFNMRPCFPLKGLDSKGNELNLRENINYFTRAYAENLFDSYGNMDFARFEAFNQNVVDKVIVQGNYTPENIAGFGVPTEKRDDFIRFISENNAELNRVDEIINLSVQYIQNMQYSFDKLYSGADPELILDKEKLLRESYPDFKARVNNLRALKDIKPETEDRILFPLDCGAYASLNEKLAGQTNAFREKKKLKKITDARHVDIDIEEHNREILLRRKEAGETIDNNFEHHFCFVAPVETDAGTEYVSIETTAPPTGKLIYCNSRGENGVGIYSSVQNLKDHYFENSLVPLPNEKAFTGIKRVPLYKLNGYKDMVVKGSFEFEMESLISVRRSVHTLESLSQRLASDDVDSPFIRSSKQFRAVKDAFTRLEAARTESEKLICMKKLNTAAQKYLEYKDPLGDKKKEKALSEYAKTRIRFVKDVLDFSSADLNGRGITLNVVKRTENYYNLLANKMIEPSDNEKTAKKRADEVLKSPAFSQIVKGLCDAELVKLLEIPSEKLRAAYESIGKGIEYFEHEKKAAVRDNVQPSVPGTNI